jgi:transglutaminase-like putative cysteine protease
MRWPLPLALSIWAIAAAEATAQAPLDPRLPYQGRTSDPVTYDVDFSVVVTPPYHAKVLKVWLPLAQTDTGQEVEEISLDTFPMKVAPRIGTEKVHGNKFAYFEFDHPQGAQMIRHRFKVTVWEMRWRLDPSQVEAVKQWPAGFEPYLRSDRSVVVDDRFRKIAADVVPMSKGPARDLAEVMRWVQREMKYSHVEASLRASSEHALLKRIGHCSDYHGLCASIGRAMGYPTRIAYGITPIAKNSPSHCKVEAFLPPYGWVCFDLSETQRQIAAIRTDPKLSDAQKEQLADAATQRLLGGFRDNTWIAKTKGTDYELVPPAKKRAAVVRTIYAEADGEALPDPDPANPKAREFAWMTMHRYTPNRPVVYPFQGYEALMPKSRE